tara:strand:+ start:5171 stop:6343 length:1173 start_codon:yes stop_codon:yes gene_type:complete
MARRIATGIDIGTHQVKVVIAEVAQTKGGSTYPKILGTGISESKGLRHGYIVNNTDVSKSVSEAHQQAEAAAGIQTKKAFLSVGGIGIDEIKTTGETIIQRADSEVTDLDVEKAIEAARMLAEPNLTNRRVLHQIPLTYRLDGHAIHGNRPQGMNGTKLEVDVLFITTLKQHHDDLVAAVEEIGIEVLDEMASPLAGSFVTLSKEQKMKGVVLANIGAETVSVVIYDHNVPVSVKVFDIGSANITDDLALALRIPPEDAEKLKLNKLAGEGYPEKRVQSIIQQRLKAIFALIDAHLKEIGKNQMLPAGVVLAGGGAGIGDIRDIARSCLKLPSRTAQLQVPENTQIKDSSWAVAYGLTIWGLTSEQETGASTMIRGAGNSFTKFFKQFLP